MKKERQTVDTLAKKAGITINGNNPYDVVVHDKRFYNRVLGQGSIGLGESYVDGWWDSEDLSEFFNHIFRAGLEKEIFSWNTLPIILKSIIFNAGSRAKSFRIGEAHYDIGNELYEEMLDKRMVYTCGYWKDAKSLDDAQEAKLDLACRKIGLKAGMKVLDIGCGWGSFAKFAVEKYGAEVVGVTVSKKQVELAKKLCKGLSVDIQYKDYRDVDGEFDAIVSLGMFEHVGGKNYRTYMEKTHELLKDDGKFLLHTIGCNNPAYSFDPWIAKYIFPGGVLPTVSQIGKSMQSLFVMEDWHNFGADYDRTLMAWFENFDKNWDSIKDNYSKRFYRMWKYYILASAGSFRSRENQLWQIVLSKNPTKRYDRVY